MVRIENSQVENLILGENYQLKKLYLSKNIMQGKLDLTNYSQLEDVGVGYNQLAEIIIGENSQIHTLQAQSNLLTNVNLQSATNLENLLIGGNPTLHQLDITGNPQLLWLDASFSSISELDLSLNSLLKDLELSHSQLTILDLSNQSNLKSLKIVNAGKLEQLIYHGDTLSTLSIRDNALSYFDTNELVLDKADLSYQTLQREITYQEGYWTLDLLELFDSLDQIKNMVLQEVPENLDSLLLWEIRDDKAIFMGEGIPASFTYNYKITGSDTYLMGVTVYTNAETKKVNFDLQGELVISQHKILIPVNLFNNLICP